MTISPKAAFALAAPIFLALIALFLGDKETPIQIGDETYVVRPLRMATFFFVIDLFLFVGMWLTGAVQF